uniref:Uncharacterized protein n=1 Tax=Onchocerca volvulus TaxID=6282 RepID=A0A8R1TUB3_ONCVO
MRVLPLNKGLYTDQTHVHENQLFIDVGKKRFRTKYGCILCVISSVAKSLLGMMMMNWRQSDFKVLVLYGRKSFRLITDLTKIFKFNTLPIMCKIVYERLCECRLGKRIEKISSFEKELRLNEPLVWISLDFRTSI